MSISVTYRGASLICIPKRGLKRLKLKDINFQKIPCWWLQSTNCNWTSLYSLLGTNVFCRKTAATNMWPILKFLWLSLWRLLCLQTYSTRAQYTIHVRKHTVYVRIHTVHVRSYWRDTLHVTSIFLVPHVGA